jgi:hypothetical protein
MFKLENPMLHLKRCKEEWCHGIQLFETMVQICTEYLLQKKDKKTDPRILALQLWSTVHGLVCLGHSNRLDILDGIPTQQLIEKTIDTTIQILTRCK